MGSYVDIANLALSRLGDDATVASLDPPEGSAQAEHCARWIPICRDMMLEMHNWKFSRTRKLLALTEASYSSWEFVYAAPGNMVRFLGVLRDGYTNDVSDLSAEYDMEVDPDTGDQLILTNIELATGLYTMQVTDPAKFPPLFADALVWFTASYVAGPLLKGDEGMAAAKACFAGFMTALAKAAASDAQQSRIRLDARPPWIDARGFAGRYAPWCR